MAFSVEVIPNSTFVNNQSHLEFGDVHLAPKAMQERNADSVERIIIQIE